jgi:molybdopterin-guanine dinucleotide biosynthesis protein A
VTGVLLVGGASRRFGSPKPLAVLGDKTLALHAWDALGWCDERLAVGKRGDALPLPFPLHDDASSVRAPLAGLVAGLRIASHDVVVALPVDCPMMTPSDLRQLASACDDAAVPQTGPLPGAYRRRVLPLLEQRLAEGQLSLRDALASASVRVVSLAATALANVNTPDDLAALEASFARNREFAEQSAGEKPAQPPM